MKKALIYVFSGTGNTKLVAGLYKKFLAPEYETVIHLIRMENKTFLPFPDADEFDLIGFGHPVYGFNVPRPMNEFCRQLPALKSSKPAFVFKTSGEGLIWNMYSSQKIIRMLEKKGYSFLTDRHIVMPYNMIFRHSDKMVKSEFTYAKALSKLNCSQLKCGFKENVHIKKLRRWFVPIVRIVWLYGRVQGPFMHVNKKKCIRCMKCVQACPLSNIKFTGKKFKFGTNCALCVACSFGCPKNAISIGLLNGWKVNGSYNIEKKASDSSIEFPAFGENLKGLHRWLYYKYYRNADLLLEQNGMSAKDFLGDES